MKPGPRAGHEHPETYCLSASALGSRGSTTNQNTIVACHGLIEELPGTVSRSHAVVFR